MVAVLGYLDRRKKRSLADLPPLSFIVPCYNDADSVRQTLESIYAACGRVVEVIVIDDCSTDSSRGKLAVLQRRLGFTLLLNPRNLGKSKTLNDSFKLAGNNTVIFVDADVIIAHEPLTDALARLQRPDVGAVSCPYQSIQFGFLQLMQTIEYNLLAFIQSGYNLFSAMALWGGFIAIRRSAFLQVGGFTLNAITEDMDLAFKLNSRGWRVEQSFYPVRTYVPDTFKKLFIQKLRWGSGGLQCFLKYPHVWLKNPLHVTFMFSFCILLTLSTLKLTHNLIIYDDIIDYFAWLNQSRGLWLSLQLTGLEFGMGILKGLVWKLSFTFLSLPFVMPLVSGVGQLYRCLLIVPFSIFYVPLFSSMSILGAITFLRKRRALKTATRAW
jgi:cellulose synthase/poly-beta-1,6-N-acetylglucosamine synthase-like glycosyltransferase